MPADAVVGSLPLAKQQQVEILRALARDAELIVFDEPTAALSAAEVQRFHEIVRGLAAGGRTVILVSHFLGEVLELADTVTVLRDGRVVKTGPAAGETEDTLVAAMLGRSVSRTYPPEAAAGRGRPVGADRPRPDRRRRDGVSLEVRAGEIVGPRGPRGRRPLGARPGDLRRRRPPTAGEMTAGTTRLTGTPLGSLAGERLDDPRVAQGRRPDAAAAGPGERQPRQPRSLGRFGFVRRGMESTRAKEALARSRPRAS